MFTLVISIPIKGTPTEQLVRFTSVGEANLVQSDQTIGGILFPNVHNCHLLTISLPKLKKNVTFRSSAPIDTLMCKASIYVLACSLDFILVHSIDFQKNNLLVYIVGDNKEDIAKFQAAIKSFDTDSSHSLD